MKQMARDELAEHLKQLATIAQQHPPFTQNWQVALTKLVNAIICSGKLCHPQSGNFPAGVYEDIYNEAKQDLLLYICQNIHKYNPERGTVIRWVNFLLERRFFPEAIPKILNERNVIQVTSEDDFVSYQVTKDLTEILRECIESDQGDIFKNKYIENYPQVNFQVLLQRRLSGKSWKEISAEFQINLKTVSSFYYRCINQFRSKLKECYCNR